MWYCEVCKKIRNINTKSAHIKSATHKENENNSRINSNLTNKAYTYLNLEVGQVVGLVKETIDDCKKFFHRFKYKYVFVIKIVNQTHGSTSYFTLSNKYKIQHEKVNEQMN